MLLFSILISKIEVRKITFCCSVFLVYFFFLHKNFNLIVVQKDADEIFSRKDQLIRMTPQLPLQFSALNVTMTLHFSVRGKFTTSGIFPFIKFHRSAQTCSTDVTCSNYFPVHVIQHTCKEKCRLTGYSFFAFHCLCRALSETFNSALLKSALTRLSLALTQHVAAIFLYILCKVHALMQRKVWIKMIIILFVFHYMCRAQCLRHWTVQTVLMQGDRI